MGFIVFVATMTILFGNPIVERLLYTDAAGQSPKVLAMLLDVPPRPAVFWVWSEVGAIGARGAAADCPVHTYRTHTCGALRTDDADRSVRLSDWVALKTYVTTAG